MTRANEHEASEWVIRGESGHFTEAMQAGLERWLEDPRNKVAYLRIKEAWRRAGHIRGARPLDGNGNPNLLKNPQLTDLNTQSLWRLRIAAAAAVGLIIYLIAVGSRFVLSPSGWISYTTSIGGYEHLTLSDGSGIQLNTDSEIRTRLTERRREVRLVRGEALIKVASDARRPFFVSAANTSVRANAPANLSERIGVIFAVRLRTPKGVDVAVTQGSVALGPEERIVDIALGRDSVPEWSLAAGEAAAVRPEGIHLARVGVEELNRKLSWTVGLLTFKGETLAEVTDEFNRFNRKQLIVTDPFIAKRRIGGAFQATDPDSFVSALQKWFGVHADEQQPAPSSSPVIRLSAAP